MDQRSLTYIPMLALVVPHLINIMYTINGGLHEYLLKIHTYIHTYVHTYVLIYVHTYIHAYIHTYIHTYVYTYIHTYIHTYIYTYIQGRSQEEENGTRSLPKILAN